MKRGLFLLFAVSLTFAAQTTRSTEAGTCPCTAADQQACRHFCRGVDPGCIGSAGCFAGSCNCSCQCP